MSTKDRLEKDFSNSRDAGHTHAEIQDDTLRRIQTAGSFVITPEIFEKMYLTPPNKVKGDLRLKFANPTPLGLTGFVIALTPLCCALMGWRGAGGGGAAEIGPYYWFGGALQLIAGVLEFFLGNTFPFVVLTSFGGFFLSFATTLTPSFNASAAYGTNVEQFHATFGFFPLFMGLLCVFYFICSLRTNIVFATIFFFLVASLGLLTAGHWQIAQGNVDLAANINIAAGAIAFVSALGGWYLLLSQLLEALDFPIQLPVGDLSGFIQSRSQRVAKKDPSQLV
ncbi:hypothetical protein V499_09756 [Pseudogymnoascus sp. VKM F-103]|uniref:Protein alcS n=1 Tax=Pseudogymnoascus verrucosus TaxID=342668 RepID=A0A1B8GLA3_9PEZI|nr:uncharacterized protein VE01_05401 [Pseudogymnoascus verrucosus]KFY69777.1 hypothetical protein V499_09756 [Pseudogymnoascus sp. VKM F-103]OBT96615.1 hypothetical protein VE01_05401 [Pseudogymnoascus verrucosus]